LDADWRDDLKLVSDAVSVGDVRGCEGSECGVSFAFDETGSIVIASELMVPTLRVVTHSMTLCVIRDVVHAVRLCNPQEPD
jgi:hypothetical protein